MTYSKLNTSLYTKSAWYPSAGLGYNGSTLWFGASEDKPFTFPLHRRVRDAPGPDTLSAVQGPRFTVYIPGPHEQKRHWFFKGQLAYYLFHPTTGANPASQLGNVDEFSVASFGVEYRF